MSFKESQLLISHTEAVKTVAGTVLNVGARHLDFHLLLCRSLKMPPEILKKAAWNLCCGHRHLTFLI